MVEDLDPEEKILNSKVQKGRKLYEDDLGIPALDNLFVLESDPMTVVTSGEDEDESENSQRLESMGDEEKVPAETVDVEMEVMNAVGGSDA